MDPLKTERETERGAHFYLLDIRRLVCQMSLARSFCPPACFTWPPEAANGALGFKDRPMFDLSIASINKHRQTNQSPPLSNSLPLTQSDSSCRIWTLGHVSDYLKPAATQRTHVYIRVTTVMTNKRSSLLEAGGLFKRRAKHQRRANGAPASTTSTPATTPAPTTTPSGLASGQHDGSASRKQRQHDQQQQREQPVGHFGGVG